MAEAKIYSLIRNHCKGIFFKRVENTCNVGTPDAYFAYEGVHGVWMEAKEIHLGEKDRTIKIPFRPLQYEWLRENTSKGGHSLLAILTEQGLFFAKQRAIQKEYEYKDFVNALQNNMSPLCYVPKEKLKAFLQHVCMY